MKKKKKGRILSRNKNQRKALLKSLAREIILRGKIITTEAKAKEVRPFLEKFITKAKKENLSSRRYLLGFLDQETTKRLIEEIAPRYKERSGGYTRIIKLGPRKRNGAKMAIIELLK
jgi:large subunit ribosomal protein L17